VADVYAVSDGETLYIFSLRGHTEYYAKNADVFQKAVSSASFPHRIVTIEIIRPRDPYVSTQMYSTVSTLVSRSCFRLCVVCASVAPALSFFPCLFPFALTLPFRLPYSLAPLVSGLVEIAPGGNIPARSSSRPTRSRISSAQLPR